MKIPEKPALKRKQPMHKLIIVSMAIAASAAFAANEKIVSLGGDGQAELRLTLPKKGDAALEVLIGGKRKQTFPHLGAAFKTIQYKGSAVPFVAIDLGHGTGETILLRTTQPPLVGSLWVFQWDKEKKAFALLNAAENGDHYIPVSRDGQVAVSENGDLAISTVGKPKLVAYHWNGKSYVRK